MGCCDLRVAWVTELCEDRENCIEPRGASGCDLGHGCKAPPVLSGAGMDAGLGERTLLYSLAWDRKQGGHWIILARAHQGGEAKGWSRAKLETFQKCPRKGRRDRGEGTGPSSWGKQMSAGIVRVHPRCLHGLEMTLVFGDLTEAWWAPFPFSLLTQ